MAAGGPIFQPVGAVDLVLVEQVGQSLGELVAFAQVGVVREEALQRLEVRLIDQLGEQAHQAPGQRGFIEQGFGRDLVAPQDHAIELPHEAAGQLHVDRRSNAAATHVVIFRIFGQGQLEPLGDAVALDQGDFIFQRGQGITTHPTDHQAAQFVQAVTVNHHESCAERHRIRHNGFLGKSKIEAWTLALKAVR